MNLIKRPQTFNWLNFGEVLRLKDWMEDFAKKKKNLETRNQRTDPWGQIRGEQCTKSMRQSLVLKIRQANLPTSVMGIGQNLVHQSLLVICCLLFSSDAFLKKENPSSSQGLWDGMNPGGRQRKLAPQEGFLAVTVCASLVLPTPSGVSVLARWGFKRDRARIPCQSQEARKKF